MNLYKYILCLFVLTSCFSEKETTSGIEITFDEENTICISDKKIIKLETSDHCLIQQVTQLEIIDDKIFVLDAFGSHKLYVFDLKGNFLANIGEQGSGPKEYILPYSFNINKKNDLLSIFDSNTNAILFYSLSSYEFIERKQIPYTVNDFCFLDNDNYVCVINANTPSLSSSHFITTDSQFQILHNFVHIEFSSGHLNPPFKYTYTLNDKTYGFIRFRNIIYEIQADKVLPKYELSFKKYAFPPVELLKKEEDNAFNRNYLPWLENSEYISSYNIFETDSLLCVDYMVTKKRNIGFFSKNKNQTFHYSLKRFQEIAGLCGIERIGGKTANGFFVALLRPEFILNQINNDECKSDEFKMFAKKISAEDNPILCVFRLETNGNISIK